MKNKDIEKMMEIIKAVAHIGVDFGFGEYEIEDKYISMARDILDEEDDV